MNIFLFIVFATVVLFTTKIVSNYLYRRELTSLRDKIIANGKIDYSRNDKNDPVKGESQWWLRCCGDNGKRILMSLVRTEGLTTTGLVNYAVIIETSYRGKIYNLYTHEYTVEYRMYNHELEGDKKEDMMDKAILLLIIEHILSVRPWWR